MTLDEYEQKIARLESIGDRDAAVQLAEVSREMRRICWNYPKAGSRPRDLINRCDEAAWRIACIGRLPRWDFNPITSAHAIP